MGIRAFFLACVSEQFFRYERRWKGDPMFRELDWDHISTVVQDGAWGVPEEAIPKHNPARAAGEYVEYAMRAAPVPDWLQAHLEAEAARGNVPPPF